MSDNILEFPISNPHDKEFLETAPRCGFIANTRLTVRPSEVMPYVIKHNYDHTVTPYLNGYVIIPMVQFHQMCLSIGAPHMSPVVADPDIINRIKHIDSLIKKVPTWDL